MEEPRGAIVSMQLSLTVFRLPGLPEDRRMEDHDVRLMGCFAYDGSNDWESDDG